jgi:photosystem II stability/assembly factor-like uncharacterized protein
MVIAACRSRPSPPRPPAVTEGVTPAAPARSPLATAPRVDLTADDPCVAPPPPTVAPRWSLVGYRPGPRLREVTATGRHHEALVAVTSREVCVSRDQGLTWRSALGAELALAAPVPVDLRSLRAVVVIAQGSPADPKPARVFVSRDRGEHWEALALPPEAGAGARVHTDGQSTLWVHDGGRLWWSDDARGWQGPRPPPGGPIDRFEACGALLVARIERRGERYFHRSDDRGASWRPLRLGHLGIDGGDGVVRCLGWRGALEAGRGALPTHWSFDGGRTWERARYDLRARAAARALAEDSSAAADPPRCGATPGGALVCRDARRIVFGLDRDHVYEVSAPAGCERVRVLDDERVMAFGPSCGVYLSADRGGIWRPVTTSVDPERAAAVGAPGRGGFVSPASAWRIDDGLWWTDDGGAHWRTILTAQTRGLRAGAFSDRRRGVFTRDDGWVAATRDGGERWTGLFREDVERLATSGPWVMLTTRNRVRVSPDAGGTWRHSRPFPADRRLDPVLVVSGQRRAVELAPGVRVVQQGRSIALTRSGETQPVVDGLPPGWELLSAHLARDVVDRVLLVGGAVLRHDPAPGDLARAAAPAHRTRPRP